MGTNFFLLAILAMFAAWFIYFKIQDRKEGHNKEKK